MWSWYLTTCNTALAPSSRQRAADKVHWVAHSASEHPVRDSRVHLSFNKHPATTSMAISSQYKVKSEAISDTYRYRCCTEKITHSIMYSLHRIEYKVDFNLTQFIVSPIILLNTIMYYWNCVYLISAPFFLIHWWEKEKKRDLIYSAHCELLAKISRWKRSQHIFF